MNNKVLLGVNVDHVATVRQARGTDYPSVMEAALLALEGGADAITQTIGGFTTAMTGDISEIVGFLRSGEVKALGILTEERVPGFEEIPTAREQGLDYRLAYIPQSFYALSNEPFDKDYMNNLFRLGRERALANQAWLRLDELV